MNVDFYLQYSSTYSMEFTFVFRHWTRNVESFTCHRCWLVASYRTFSRISLLISWQPSNMPNSSCQLPVKCNSLQPEPIRIHVPVSFQLGRACVYVHWSNLLRMRHAYFILFACLARYYRPTWRMINIKWQRQCTLPAIQKQSAAPLPPPDCYLPPATISEFGFSTD